MGPEAIRAPERQCFQLDTAHCSMHPSTAPQHTHCLLTTIYVPLCPSLLCPMPYLLLPCDFTPEPGPTQAPPLQASLLGCLQCSLFSQAPTLGWHPPPATLGHLQNTFEVCLALCLQASVFPLIKWNTNHLVVGTKCWGHQALMCSMLISESSTPNSAHGWCQRLHRVDIRLMCEKAEYVNRI